MVGTRHRRVRVFGTAAGVRCHPAGDCSQDLQIKRVAPMIRIYTDGAAQGNPGPGGYGVILKYNEHVKEISEGFRLTTNNRMELLAVITGLEAIKREGIPVSVYSDSQYVVKAVEQGWIWNWEKKNFAA